MRFASVLLMVLLAAACVAPVQAQNVTFGADSDRLQNDLLQLYLPKIEVAADGSYGIVAEGLFRTSTGRDVLHVLAQRFSAAGDAVGPTHVFEGESCSGLDIWLSDYMERPEVAFHPNGSMLVLMQHTGELQLGGDGIQSAEITLGGIDANGQLMDLAPNYSSCVQHKFIFVGGGRQDRPRFDLTPSGEVLVAADGFFGGSSLRNVAFRVLDAAGDELIEEVVPHADAASEQSFHMHPDIATSGALMVSAWHRCPVVDSQGNAEECDVEVQFASVSEQGLQAVGVNQRVNAGDPAGTLNVYPSAAMNAAGASVVAWADGRDGLHGEIYAQRFDAAGQAVGGNFRVSAGEGGIDSRPEAAILDNGRIMIAWTDSSAVGFRARARTYDSGGNPEAGTFELAPGSTSGEPSVAADGNDFATVYLTVQDGVPSLGSNKSATFTAAERSLPVGSGIASAVVYPNPLVNGATLTYELSSSGDVLIRVYDILGREVDRLLEGSQSAGRHGIDFDVGRLAPGVYLLEIQAGQSRKTLPIIRTQ